MAITFVKEIVHLSTSINLYIFKGLEPSRFNLEIVNFAVWRLEFYCRSSIGEGEVKGSNTTRSYYKPLKKELLQPYKGGKKSPVIIIIVAENKHKQGCGKNR